MLDGGLNTWALDLAGELLEFAATTAILRRPSQKIDILVTPGALFVCTFGTKVQTGTRAAQGFTAGVKDYRLTYYMKDYQVHIDDLLAAFRVIAQPGVPPEEAGAAIAAESSTGTWTTVWTDGLTSLDRYKGRCYDIELVSGEDNQYIASPR